MKIKSNLLKPVARRIARNIERWRAAAPEAQDLVFQDLIKKGRRTAFGREHGFEKIKSHEAFRAQVPLRDYEALRPWIDRIKTGERDVLWPGLPKYFAKTSGTQTGVSFISPG